MSTGRYRCRNLFWLWLIAAAACGDMVHITVAGSSMLPTYKNGDELIASKRVDTIERGDVVGFRYPKDESRSFIQRVVGLPGEQIEIRSGITYINGQPIEERYVAEENRLAHTSSPVMLGADEYFMMGDNRANSSDSRTWGPVKRSAIWAKLGRKDR